MLSRTITEWLSEFKALPESQLSMYADRMLKNEKLISSLLELFESAPGTEVLSPVCHQLFEFERSTEPSLQQFVLGLLPALIETYLLGISHGNRLQTMQVETLLLSLYNNKVIKADGKPDVRKYRIPALQQPSLYHDPMTTCTLPLPGINLPRETHEIQHGPFPTITRMSTMNRLSILAYMVSVYNQNISLFVKASLKSLCRLGCSISTEGFDNINMANVAASSTDIKAKEVSDPHGGNGWPRVTVSSDLLIEILHGVSYCMFHGGGLTEVGIEALHDIHNRACYELLPDVLLLTHAMRSSLQFQIASKTDEGAAGIAMLQDTNIVCVSKTAITNASFRSKKLPDDIPEQDGPIHDAAPTPDAPSLHSDDENQYDGCEDRTESSVMDTRKGGHRLIKLGSLTLKIPTKISRGKLRTSPRKFFRQSGHGTIPEEKENAPSVSYQISGNSELPAPQSSQQTGKHFEKKHERTQSDQSRDSIQTQGSTDSGSERPNSASNKNT